jgi:cell division transport system ATP-binding protein
VNLEIDPGEFVFLVGASGSGKSTMVRLILKETEPSAGAVYVNRTRLSSVTRRKIPRHRRDIGCVFQDFKLLPNRTVAENVAYAMEVTGQKRSAIRTKVPQILDLVGLSGKLDKFPDQLSGGEQQRVSIARAFVSQPPILVADEPTGNLDPNTSVGIMQLLHRINRMGTTVLVATHDKEMVDAMRKRVVALEEGRVVRDKVKGAYADEV